MTRQKSLIAWQNSQWRIHNAKKVIDNNNQGEDHQDRRIIIKNNCLSMVHLGIGLAVQVILDRHVSNLSMETVIVRLLLLLY
jgi:hypothetical protein